jgi:predicted ATPase/DNA-binding SARP family transcriptional activator
VDVAVLGPLVIGDGEKELSATKERAIVELLALQAPHPASVEALIDAVWGARPPATAAKTLQSLVSRVRHAVPGLLIERVGEAYRLVADRVDAREFEALVVDGRRALEHGDADDAIETLSTARRLWRGAPAPDLVDGPARSACVRLEELFRTMVDDLNEARLEVGGDAALIADLDSATLDEPLREQRWAQLMVALHRDGRQAEALRAFQRARHVLGEQLGLEPSDELRDLERAIISDDDSLTVAWPTWPGQRRTRRVRHTAPQQRAPALTSFVGRSDEIRLVSKRLDEARLVTITGPGGVGKTRLTSAVLDQVEDRFPHGVWFVDLTPTTERRSMTAAIAEAVGVREVPGTDLDTTIATRCSSSSGLLVLDNCEHVLADAAALVHRLVVAARSLRLLATSREPLGVAGEVVVALSPLETPASDEHDVALIAAIDAVRLYADRAVAVEAAFEINERNAAAVASLCRRLDGLPLAIELAAAQAYVLGPAQIDARLAERFTILQSYDRHGLERHRTLTALVDWSAARLAPSERTIFHRLAVFRGSMSLEAIEAVVVDGDVAPADVLPALVRLVRSSLVVAEGTGAERRYRLLETVRQYGQDRLADDGDLGRRRDRHRDWALTWAVRAAARLRGDQHVSSFEVLDEEHDNLEAALEWSATDPDRAAVALDAIQALYHFWLARGTRRAQGVHWTMAIAQAAVSVPPADRVRAMARANVIIGQSDLAAAAEIAATARRLAATAPDDERAALYAAIATCWTDVAAGRSPPWSALAATSAQDPDDPDRNWIDAILSSCLATTGDLAGGRLYIRRAVDHPRLVHDRHVRGSFMTFAVDIDAAIGDHLDQAQRDAREALEIATDLACPSCAAQALVSLLLVDRCEDLGGPIPVARRSLRLAHSIGETMGVIRALDMLVGAFGDEGHAAIAARVAGATDTVRRRTGYAEHEPGRRAYRRAGVDRARACLTQQSFDAQWNAGRRLDYQQLIDELLDDPSDGDDTA